MKLRLRGENKSEQITFVETLQVLAENKGFLMISSCPDSWMEMKDGATTFFVVALVHHGYLEVWEGKRSFVKN